MTQALSSSPKHLRDLRSVVVVDGCRTPFRRAAGAFVDTMSYELAAAVIRGLLERNTLSPEQLDRVIFGATVHSPKATNVAREAAFAAGVPNTVPSHTLTAAGASATVAFSQGIDLIITGQAQAVVVGGTDCISDPPIGYSRAMRTKLLRARRLKTLGQKLAFAGSLRPWDFLPEALEIKELSTGQTMGQYTEDLACRLAIDRQKQDAFALRSHQRAHRARQQLAKEIVPVPLANGTVVTEDDGIRPQTDLDTLARLKPSFRPDGTLTAGNSSFLTDGAAGLLLMSATRARELGLPIRAHVRGRCLTAHDPQTELLLGPVFAMPQALEEASIELEQVGVFEIHEAFAAQMLAVLELSADQAFARSTLGRPQAMGEIPQDKLNTWGGSLAIGNPFAPNGARLLTTAVHRLHEENQDLAMVATCAGGALGHAFILERA